VYDDLFTTVPNGEVAPVFDTGQFAVDDWERLISSGGLERADIPTFDDDTTVFRLDDEWRSPAEIERNREEERQRRLERLVEPEDLFGPPPLLPREPVTPLRELEPENDPFNLFDDDAFREVTFGDGVAPPVRDLTLDFQDEAAVEPRPRQPSPPPGVRRSTRVRKPNQRFKGDEWTNLQQSRLSTQRVRAGLLNSQFLQSLDWNAVVESLPEGSWKAMATNIMLHTDDEGQVNWLHPLALATKANNEDNPNWNQAMNGPNSEGFWEAMATEIRTLVEKMDAWEVVDRETWMNVLPSTWAFKCKRFPDGLVKKLKARFCVRGDKQLEGIDFFETFAPVVSWTTVRLMLILTLVLGLYTRQVDYTAAFLHAPIDEDPDLEFMGLEERKRTGVFVEMPRGFSEPGKVLKLKKSLYGLKQAPRNFFQHLKNKLEKIGFTSSEADPCLFISDKVICIVYVDDTLLFSPRPEYIDDVLAQLREENLDLEEEDDVAGFLGVNVERDSKSGEIRMTQVGLINRIIEALGCDNLPRKKTPAEYGALGTDKDGDPPQESFSYPSVIGMLQYLHTHTRPDLTFAVSQCSRFIHCTKRSHELALIRIGQYLKMTRDKGLVLRPTNEMGIDCYVDADFAGLWGVEDPQDPTSVKSRPGYVLCIAGCPVIWASKLQSDIALSTMEAEYNALSTALKDLLPLKRLVQTVAKAVNIPLEPQILMRVTVWEDNTGALTLANLEPGRMTPRSKHYGVKYHWFREHLKPNGIQVLKIDTKNQQADMLTKALRTDKFELNRKQLMGWLSSTILSDHLRSKGSVKILDKTARYLANSDQGPS
jgi:Reverse transcriptase (RNA-dependent DNA polymerase)